MNDLPYREKVQRQIIREKDGQKLLEDIEHFYFCALGILVCAMSGWRAAIIAAGTTVGIREFLRWYQRRKEYGDV